MEIKIIRRWAGTIMLLTALAMAAVGLALLSQITSNMAEFGRLYQTILLVNQISAQWNIDLEVFYEEGAIDQQLRRGPIIENEGRGTAII